MFSKSKKIIIALMMAFSVIVVPYSFSKDQVSVVSAASYPTAWTSIPSATHVKDLTLNKGLLKDATKQGIIAGIAAALLIKADETSISKAGWSTICKSSVAFFMANLVTDTLLKKTKFSVHKNYSYREIAKPVYDKNTGVITNNYLEVRIELKTYANGEFIDKGYKYIKTNSLLPYL